MNRVAQAILFQSIIKDSELVIIKHKAIIKYMKKKYNELQKEMKKEATKTRKCIA